MVVNEQQLSGRVLITGGAGFLGRAILARAKREGWPARFTVLSRDEQKQDLCRRRFPDAQYVLGDVRDLDRLRLLMKFQDVVIHAAAMKYIPESELNVNESIGVNIGGTQTVVQAVHDSGAEVRTMVFISTDKAVEPLNTYGFTKALGERIIYEASRRADGTRFVAVRYGNVIGSTGSVVPVLIRQAADFRRLKITSPHMSRFWISADEAINLVLWAVWNAASGGITIPTPRAMYIGDVGEAVCPGVPQDIVGLRPGEKIHEKLISHSESVRCCSSGPDNTYSEYHPDYAANPDVMSYELSSENALRMSIDEFRRHAEVALQL